MAKKYCKECGELIVGVGEGVNKRFCSNTCRLKFTTNRRDGFKSFPNVTNYVDKGAMTELAVCVDLLAKGYDVYRSVSPSALCDLIAVMGKRTIRIEVKTGKYLDSGSYSHTDTKNNQFDILAVYLPDRIAYEPPLI